MQQLLQIESVPIKLEITSTRARFEKPDPYQQPVSFNSSALEKNSNGFQGVSTGTAAASRPGTDVYVGGMQSTYGQMLTSEAYMSGKAASITDVVASSAYVKAGIQNSQLSAAGSTSSQSELISGAMSTYEADRASFDMNVSLGITDFEFVPGSIEFNVAQRPEVRIEYIGAPIYVPRSAAPNYIDTTA